ncbi:MAG: ABC transporter ATP-binding protein [Vicinamibacteria bacterium]
MASQPSVASPKGLERPIVVSLENVSKSYFLWNRPQDRLKHALFGRFGRNYGREFWALRDVSFQIRAGEAVGVVGRNGSGKSTLLQIITGTVAPSHGRLDVSGRIASLLELGSGFNPEFTGKENVFLNGSILGISEDEMRGRFEEIAAFADIGDFMDQPLRVYSSGMIMRLAFAVQVVVRKDILIVDEALAVGDEAFQRKCMAVMEEFQRDGGTILLVSHALQTIVRQCERAMLLHGGELLADDDSKIVTDVYQKLMYSPPDKAREMVSSLRRDGARAVLSEGTRTSVSVMRSDRGGADESGEETAKDWLDPDMPSRNEVRYGSDDADIEVHGLFAEDGRRVNVVVGGRRYEWKYGVEFRRDATHVNFGMMLKTVDGIDVAGLSSDRELLEFDHIRSGARIKVTFSFRMNVVPSVYFLNAGVGGLVDGEFVYLARRVDVEMIRVVPADRRARYGITELEHGFSWEELPR